MIPVMIPEKVLYFLLYPDRLPCFFGNDDDQERRFRQGFFDGFLQIEVASKLRTVTKYAFQMLSLRQRCITEGLRNIKCSICS